ncbi:expressed protein [Arabidopsis lyrata subsp. lyrata]|uniref:Expressed protein n=1 Tax=Arabidopsis lyrata subsp. lyrata TaxID=81972 RepID=D7L834_ARALL|nr:uncharacterized protein LOC9321830 [Arabidopsis lyrata subsp. lyrata]EFH62023.1 expressed protein [Arabidopsis lyrata subsp. lyrata]|eukprot:XP_002885764.1 uncharacterized protein LOC9321830 [Arabidopsis lyrata subsp. lyrata]
MEKISMKFAFVAFFVVTFVMCIITIQNVEARRVLSEEIPQIALHRDENRWGLGCKKGCHLICYAPDPTFPICRCIC